MRMKRGIKVKRFLRNSVRVYFAPFIGAYRQMRYELRKAAREQRR